MSEYAYKYDEGTGEYLYAVPLQRNPRRLNEYLYPPKNTLQKQPPAPGINQVAAKRADVDDWELVADFRGKEYFLPDGSHHRIEQIREVPPEDALDEPAPPTQEEQKKQKHEQWKADRQAKVDAIVVEIDGMKFDGDETSQSRMARAGALAESPDETIRWILADNTVVMVTSEQLKRAVRAAGLEQEKLWIPEETDPEGQ